MKIPYKITVDGFEVGRIDLDKNIGARDLLDVCRAYAKHHGISGGGVNIAPVKGGNYIWKHDKKGNRVRIKI